MSASVQVETSDEARSSAEQRDDKPHSPPGDSDPEKCDHAQSASNTTNEEGIRAPRQEATLQKWNEPRANMYRFFTTLYSFIIMGMNDGAMGALLPYLETYYDVSYTVLSLVFLAPFVGYLLAALLNNLIHHHFGQLGVAVISPICRLVGYLPLAFHPPYPALPVLLLFPGFGNGLEDSGWNAWVGNMQRANELLGFLHGAYGLGATIGPLVATAMVAKGGLPWYSFYYLMVGMCGLESLLAVTAFRHATAEAYRRAHQSSYSSSSSAGAGRTTTRHVLREPTAWLVALFLLGYVGAEVSLGGWIVTFMLKVRHAAPFAAGLTATFFWLGLTVGRVALGFVTGRVPGGEKGAVAAYLACSIALQLLYWLVPARAASSVFVAFLGFFLGPLFPAAIVAAAKLLPSGYHVSAIGFAAAMGGGGGALFPFAVGAVAERRGVGELQPIVLATLVFVSFVWWLLPGGMRRGGLEQAREDGEPVGYQVRRWWAWLRMRIRSSPKAE